MFIEPSSINANDKYLSLLLRLITYFSILIIFSGAFVVKTGFFDFYFYYAFALLTFPILLLYSKVKFHKGFLTIIIIFFGLGLINVLLRNNTFALLAKQLVGIIFVGTFFFYLLKSNGFNWLRLFGIYMNVAKVIGAIAIVQTIAYLLHFRPLYDYSYFIPGHRVDTTFGFIRVSSVLVEPSHYITAMAPAIFISVFNIFKKTRNFIGRSSSFMIVISVLLTFSMIGYLSLLLSFIFLFRNPFSLKKILVTIIFLVTSIFILYLTVDPVTSRLDGLIELFVYGKVHRVNISSFTFFNNYTVASQNFLNHPIIGTGLGSHQLAFNKYAYKDVFDPNLTGILNSLNKEDANSLFFRLLSETGLVGLGAMSFFLIGYRVKSKYMYETGWLISTSILVLVLLKLARDGHYFNHGFLFFIWLYYYVKKEF